MEKNKNTLLLTVIAIATLLVAVIGATFAFFTAQMGGSEDSSSVMATAVNLYIDYLGGTATLTSADAQHAVEPNPSETPFIIKSFTITPRYNEGAEAMAYLNLPYTVNLVVTKNTFKLDNAKTGASISYKLVRNSTAGIESDTDYKPIAYYGGEGAAANDITTENGGNGDLAEISIYANDGTETKVRGVVLGSSQFNKGDNAAHSYTLNIYFLDDETNQDEDKDKEFSAYINVSTGNLAVSE